MIMLLTLTTGARGPRYYRLFLKKNSALRGPVKQRTIYIINLRQNSGARKNTKLNIVVHKEYGVLF
jgi:hypothetical protein